MKIAVISPSPQHLQAMAHALQERLHQVQMFEGGKTRMPTVAEQEQPDLMVVDGMCCDPADLAPVEQVTTRYPRMAVVLLCAQQTPEFLLQSMRAGVREVLASPAPLQALVDAVQRIAAKMQDSLPHRFQGQTLAFLPCKGGAGATFLATNLGWALARQHSVLLIDLNLQFGDALSYLHDGKPSSTVADVAHDIHRLDASFLSASAVKVSANLHVLAAPEDAMHAMDVEPEHVDAIVQQAASHYEFVLLDMGRVLDPLSLRVLDRAQFIVPVVLPNVPAVRNAQKLLRMFKDLGYPEARLHPVLNRVDKRHDIGLPEVRKTLGASLQWHAIPDAPQEVQAAINAGTPLAETHRNSPVVRDLAAWAEVLSPQVHADNGGFLNRLFRRA